ncbi:MAG: DUF6174 domain-containing protein [Gemmatimonadota bacterium]
MTRSMGIRGLRTLLIAVAAASWAACLPTSPEDDLADEVAFYRQLWESSAPASYSFALRHTCFCGIPVLEPVRVTVGPSGIVSQVFVSTNEPVGAELSEVWPDVDGLFSVLEDALERDAERIDVTWNTAMGYPAEIYIDFSENISDEEQGYIVVEAPAATGQR